MFIMYGKGVRGGLKIHMAKFIQTLISLMEE